MSTHCHIGIIRANGRVKSIYCHHDGGSPRIARILMSAYDTAGDVEALLKLGDISVLGERLGPGPGPHSIDRPQPGVTVAYIRDDKRERSENRAHTDHNLAAFRRICGDAHAYLFDAVSGQWLASEPDGPLLPLDAAEPPESTKKGRTPND